MKKLNIFICDLTHTGNKIATDNIPLGIGFLAAYARKRLGDVAVFSLFKYPEVLLRRLQEEEPDILCCSNFCWNNDLNEYFCRYVKTLYPDTITLKGGPNFPLQGENRIDYLKEHKYTDFYIPYEGEEAFVIFLQTLLERGKKDAKMASIEGCTFLDEQGKLVSGGAVPRFENLDEIPSPYLSGILDEFFDKTLIPTIETTRGCPFSCNYCNSGYNYYSLIRHFSFDRVKKELHYIGKKAKNLRFTCLIITDMNFGMYSRDYDIALEIKHCQELYEWPTSICIETGKNKIDNIKKVMKVLKDHISMKMSSQSYSNEVLSEIKRKNINTDAYAQIFNDLNKEGISVNAELIVPLPKETYRSYLDGVEVLVNSGVERIVSYTLQLNYGTVYKEENYLREFNYETFYRPYVNCGGKYNGQIIVEAEEVGVATATLSFDEYLKIREFSLLLEVLYSHEVFNVVFHYIQSFNLPNYAFLEFCYQKMSEADNCIKKVFYDFVEETKNELFQSKHELMHFFAKEENFIKLRDGIIGRNVISSNSAIILGKYLENIIDFVINCFQIFLSENGKLYEQEEIKDLTDFINMKVRDVFSKNAEPVICNGFKYDISKWLSTKDTPLSSFKEGNKKIFFYFTAKQMKERIDNFSRYGEDIAGITKMLAKIDFRKLCRTASETDPNKNKKISMN